MGQQMQFFLVCFGICSWPRQCLEISIHCLQEWRGHFSNPLLYYVGGGGFTPFLYGICHWAVHEIRHSIYIRTVSS